MAGNVTGLHRFADDVGPIPLSLLDTNFDALTQSINTLATFSNFYVDTGTTNALTITPPSTQNVSYTDGLTVEVRVAATNTGASTLNIGTLGPQPIQLQNGSPLSGNELQASAISSFVYNASRNAWQLAGGGGGGGGGGGASAIFTTPFTVNDTAGQAVLKVLDGAAAQAPYSGIVNMSPGNATDPATILSIAGMPNYSTVVVNAGANTATGHWVAEFHSAPGTVVADQNGVLIQAASARDSALTVTNTVSGNPLFNIFGDGSGSLGPYPNQLVWNAAGNFTLTGSATLPGGGSGGVSYLSQLLDVALTSQTNGQVLTWNSTSNRWVNQTPVTALAGLSDVSLTSPAANQVLTYNGVRWVNTAPTLANLGDVTVTSPTAGQFLSWNGTRWVNVPAPSGGGGGSGSPFTAPFYINNTTGVNYFSVLNDGSGYLGPKTTGGTYGMSWPAAGGFTMYAPASSTGTTLLVEGAVIPNTSVVLVTSGVHTVTGQWMMNLASDASAAGCSNGLTISAGTNASDSPLTVQNQAKTATLFSVMGDGSGTLGPAATNLKWTTSTFTFTSTNAAVSPITVVVPPSTTPGNWLWTVGSSTPSGSSAGCSNGMVVYSGTNASDSAFKALSDGGAKTFLNLKGDGSGTIGPASSWDVNGVWTFGPTGTGVQEIIRGSPLTTSGHWFFQIGGGASGATAGNSNGLYVGAGTNSLDVALWVQSDAGTADYLIIHGDGDMYFPSILTTTSAANAVFDQTHNNEVLRSTSSGRFKTQVCSLTLAGVREAVRRLRAVSYKSKCPADDPRRTHYGLIAEEVAEVDPNLVTWDREGRPDGVQYERIVMLMLPLMQELLEARA